MKTKTSVFVENYNISGRGEQGGGEIDPLILPY